MRRGLTGGAPSDGSDVGDPEPPSGLFRLGAKRVSPAWYRRELDESPIKLPGRRTERRDMNPPLVRCEACTRTWHSRTMSEGLRAVGCCPRCSGTLVWSESPAPAPSVAAALSDALAPHLVMGVPRR